MIRVLLAEDQALVRGALAALLCLEGGIEVVAEVARGEDVVPAALAARANVALLDIEMPGGDGLTAASALRAAVLSCRVVILTTFGRSGYLRRATRVARSGSCSRMRRRRTWPEPCAASWPANGSSTPNWPPRPCRTGTIR